MIQQKCEFDTISSHRRHRLHRARGHMLLPTFTNGWARGGTLSRKTAKLSVYCTENNETTNCICRAKKWRCMTKIFFRRLPLDVCAPPHFQICSGATASCGSMVYFSSQQLSKNIELAKTEMTADQSLLSPKTKAK